MNGKPMTLREQLKQANPVICCAMGQLRDPKLVEMIAQSGNYDAIWFDQEHAGWTSKDIEEGTRAARGANINTFVRLPVTDYASAMRPLEAGADGIMASMVRSAAEVENLVRWSRFHPEGLRGVNGTGVDGNYGSYGGAEYFANANKKTMLAAQVECIEALEQVEGMAAVKGLDLLFIGPADLSQSLGIPGQWDHPLMKEATKRVAKAAHANGIAWGILPRDLDHASFCLEYGCNLLSLGMDVWFFQQGLKSYWSVWKDLVSKTK